LGDDILPTITMAICVLVEETENILLSFFHLPMLNIFVAEFTRICI